ncbi:hypothetical protein CALCODRAFT_100376 [Calocera cornea HHB12733]|uniref:Uncharacterized protein n=1 Tax=Calocera cornea HHB12733 TaxID=1353952 RepID=A0A165D5Y5_9BASI|nr:hypothetical protein CALCODRAFT_100376 [Calocera cornea HHB12733]
MHDDRWLTIQPDQYRRRLRDKHAFIGFPWENNYFHIGICQDRTCGFAFHHKDPALRKRQTAPPAEVVDRRMRQFRAFLVFCLSELGDLPIICHDQYRYGNEDIASFLEMREVNLDLPQLQRLNRDWINLYEGWAENAPWKADDDYFSKYEPFLVILKYGQNAGLTLSDEGWDGLTETWGTKYSMEKLGRFTVALAIVQEAVSDFDGETPLGVVADANGVKAEFMNPNGTFRKINMFPLAYTKTACNIQTDTLPNFLAEGLHSVNERIAKRRNAPANASQAVMASSYQLYACPKNRLRPATNAHNDLRLGKMTAALVGCGQSGSKAAAVKRLIDRIKRKTPFARAADRLLVGNTLIGVRSEPEFVFFPDRFPPADRNAKYVPNLSLGHS